MFDRPPSRQLPRNSESFHFLSANRMVFPLFSPATVGTPPDSSSSTRRRGSSSIAHLRSDDNAFSLKINATRSVRDGVRWNARQSKSLQNSICKPRRKKYWTFLNRDNPFHIPNTYAFSLLDCIHQISRTFNKHWRCQSVAIPRRLNVVVNSALNYNICTYEAVRPVYSFRRHWTQVSSPPRKGIGGI